MSTTVISNSVAPADVLTAIASDAGATGALDAGDGTGLGTGSGTELSSGAPANPTLCLEVLGGANNRRAAHGDSRAPIEACIRLDRDAPFAMEARAAVRTAPVAPGESLRRAAGDSFAAAESSVLFLLDPPLPIAPDSAVPADRPRLPIESLANLASDLSLAVESGRQLIGDYRLVVESLVGTQQDAQLCLASRLLQRVDAVLSIETRGSVRLRADALPPFEITRLSRADVVVAQESRGTYVASVTLTLTDGRVITFAAI